MSLGAPRVRMLIGPEGPRRRQIGTLLLTAMVLSASIAAAEDQAAPLPPAAPVEQAEPVTPPAATDQPPPAQPTPPSEPAPSAEPPPAVDQPTVEQPSAPEPQVPVEPPTQAPPPPAPAEPPQPAPPSPVAEPPSTPSVVPPAVPSAPPVERDHRVGLRGGVNTRGQVKDKVGMSLAAEMTSPYRKHGRIGLGIEFQLLQSQTDSAILSYLPVYWVARWHPLAAHPAPYLTGRFGFDLMGQEGDDTLASRNYYAVGLGLIRHPERAKSLQIELLYSRDQGAFTGFGIGVGYLY